MGKIRFGITAHTLGLLLCGCALQAQFNLGFRESLALPIHKNGALRLATVGGFSNPQFSEIDLNGDAHPDLFVFDRGMDTWRTFTYDAVNNRYNYAPQYESAFPSGLHEMTLLRDFDCDGRNDIFTYVNGGVKVYRNVGSSPLSFSTASEKLRSNYGSLTTTLFLLQGDLPAITDVDGDGDLDILAFGNGDSENSIVWHRNTSMDDFGTCDSLRFVVETECWGGIQNPAGIDTLIGFACDAANVSGSGARLHPGSTLTLVDTDGDDDKDLMISDTQSEKLVFAPNIGSAANAQIDTVQQTTLFPNATHPALLPFMPAAYEIDANHDGKIDLIIAPNNNIDHSCNAGHTWLYTNTATTGTSYQRETTHFLLNEILDLGTGAVPLYFDADGDGLTDLLVATDFFRSPTETATSRIHYFRNSGTATSPVFTHENADYAGLSAHHLSAASPTLGDLDGDGDLDMIIGTASGTLHYFENTPSGGVANFSLAVANYLNISATHASPDLCDLNGDSLLDMIVGERTGTLHYYQNNGTDISPAFDATPSISNLGAVDVSHLCCLGHASPRLVENETAFGSGKFLFVGSSEKRIYVYKVGENLHAPFALADSITILGHRIAPAFADINADGITDLMCGTGEGGLKFFDRDKNYRMGLTNIAQDRTSDVVLLPNPATNEITLQSAQPMSGKVVIRDLQGRTLLTHMLNNSRETTLALALPCGTYIVSNYSEGRVQHQKLVVQP